MLAWLAGAATAQASEINPDDPRYLIGLEWAEVIVLGEVHDNPAHHELQSRIVRTLQPGALVFEMLEPRHAAAARDIPRSYKDALAIAFEWEERGWPDFDLYYPIFAAAPKAEIFGAALPPDKVRRAVTEGAAAVFGGASSIFGLDQPLPEEQLAARVALQDAAHCNAMPGEMLPGMVEAQRLRDAALARATLEAVEEMRRRDSFQRVVVITGNGHARTDWGMPEMLARAYPEFGDDRLRLATLAQFEVEAPEDPPYRHWVVTDAPERKDPCLAFAK
ncbi:MAG: ChaN family lipoprotein [Pseudomonadota bacterium]